jgi:hypothetical protein
MQSVAALLGMLVAAIAIVVAIRVSRNARHQQIENERSAAALLHWAGVRTMQASCREWIKKFSGRRRKHPDFVARDPFTPRNVLLSSRMYESQLLRRAHFSLSRLEQVASVYEALKVYRLCRAKDVQLDRPRAVEQLHEVLHEVLDLELRAEDLAWVISAEAKPVQTQPKCVAREIWRCTRRCSMTRKNTETSTERRLW